MLCVHSNNFVYSNKSSLFIQIRNVMSILGPPFEAIPLQGVVPLLQKVIKFTLAADLVHN